MNYEIIGQTLPVVEIKLNNGEMVYTQNGAMAYQSDGIEMNTNARGGVMKSIGRVFSGESLFIVNYTAQRDGAYIGFAATVPGVIKALDMSELPSGIVLQKGAFLCAQNTVNMEMVFNKRLGVGLFGGEGFILQKAQGSGMLFLEIDGDAIEKELAPGEVLKVDTGNIVAFEPTVSYEIETVKGLGNMFLGGEGIFLTKLVGPGKVIIQSQNFADFAKKIVPYIPVERRTSSN